MHRRQGLAPRDRRFVSFPVFSMSLPLSEPRTTSATPAGPSATGLATGKSHDNGRVQPGVTPRLLRLGIGALVLVAAALATWAWLASRVAPPPQIAYSELLTALREKRVESIVIRPGDVVLGEWAGAAGDANGAEHDFAVSYPLRDVEALAARAEAAGVRLTLENAPGRTTPRSILTLAVQLLLLAGRLGFAGSKRQNPP